MKELRAILAQQALDQGPLPFSDFMQAALYHEKYGYYTSQDTSADFYTNADVGEIFAKILARYFYKQAQQMFASSQEITLVELGAGTGKLGGDIVGCLLAEFPDFEKRFCYIGVETSARRRALAETENAALSGHMRFSSEYDFPVNAISGIIFSNEFFDALPFHRIRNYNGILEEIYINESLEEVALTPRLEVRDYLSWIGRIPPENAIGEAHLACREWLRKIAMSLKKGLILSIDYGYESHELYSQTRPLGTALCHYRHQTNREFYARIGEQDITAQVNFSALIQEGSTHGLLNRPLKTQSAFLLEHGLIDFVKAVDKSPDPRHKLKMSSAIKSLIHPEGMGGIFKVLEQLKS